MRVTRRRLVLISDRANDVPLLGPRAANIQAVSIYAGVVENRSTLPVYGNLFSAAADAR